MSTCKVPLPRCSEVIAHMCETFAPHLKGLREDGDPIPSSRASLSIVVVGLAATA